MTHRAVSAAETRQRIVRGACAVYAREGFRNASMQAVARAADVSPATVLNHFKTADELLAVALEFLTASLGLPEPAELQALESLEQRITRLARDLATCYERGEKWYQASAGDRDMPALRAANDAFFRRVDALVRAALGPGLRNKHTVAVARALTGHATVGALRASGMTSAAAADTVADVLLSWLRRRKRGPRA